MSVHVGIDVLRKPGDYGFDPHLVHPLRGRGRRTTRAGAATPVVGQARGSRGRNLSRRRFFVMLAPPDSARELVE